MPEIVLPRPRAHQADKIDHPSRHKILVCGRRWGKTQAGIHCAIVGHGPGRIHKGAIDGASIWIIDQNHPSSTTLWYAVRGTVAPFAKHVSEANRRVHLIGGGTISVKSAVSVDSLVGDISGLDGVVMNEAAKFDPLVWQKAIRPALSDTKGWSFWPSTPEGFNYFHTLYENAQEPGENGEWARWQEASTENKFFDENEIESARKEGLAELLVQQEFYGKFVVLGSGRAFFEFSRAAHLDESAQMDERLGIDLCMDFSSSPPSWLVTQSVVDARERALSEVVVGEILPPGGDPSTRAMLSEFRRRYPQYSGGKRVRVFGEVAGRAVGFSDFETVRAGLPDAKHYVRSVASDEKDRTNAVNAILRDSTGRIRARIHPCCEKLVRDLEGSRNSGASAAMDRRTPGLGKYTSAWGTKLIREYPAVVESIRARTEAGGRWGSRPVDTPEAKRARDLYWTAVRAGKIARPNACEMCGAVGYVEADHRDYSQPLVVTHCCRSCHRRLPPAGGTVSGPR